MRARNFENSMNSLKTMKTPTDISLIPSALDINSNPLKPPHVSSGPVPSLLNIDPMAPFEFHFPAEEPWWDEYDCFYDTSDCTDSLFSSDSDIDPHEDLDISFTSMFYHISRTPNLDPELISTKEEILIPKLVSTMLNVAPKNVYEKRRNSMKRRRQRRRRKKMAAASIDPELRSLWTNFVDVLPATDTVLPPPPISTLPTINLSTVNKLMLRRLPDVNEFPIQSCSNDEDFYTKAIQYRRDSTIILLLETSAVTPHTLLMFTTPHLFCKP